MHKTLIAATRSAVLLGGTTLPMTAQVPTQPRYKNTQKCAIPPGGNHNACITVRWEAQINYRADGTRYWAVRPMSVTYRNDSTNGIATFNPNNYFAYTVNRGSCVYPLVGLQSYGSVQMGPSTGPRTIPFPNTAFRQDFRCPTWTTPVRINNGSTVQLTSRWSDPAV